MSHVRQQLREAAEARLTGLPVTGPRVFKHHYALGEGDYPALRVTTMNETSERLGDFECGILLRDVELLVEAWATGRDDLEDTLDDIAAEVEAAIGLDETFDGVAVDTVLSGTEKAVDPAAERRVGQLTLTFTVRVQTHPGAPETAI